MLTKFARLQASDGESAVENRVQQVEVWPVKQVEAAAASHPIVDRRGDFPQDTEIGPRIVDRGEIIETASVRRPLTTHKIVQMIGGL